MLILSLFFSIIVTEAVTELLVKSEFFKPLRAWFFARRSKKVFNFIHELLDCGYCTSVWIGFVTSLVLVNLNLISPFVDWFVAWLVVHRCSNLWHFIIDRVKGEII